MEKINFKQLLKCGERIVIPMIQRNYAQGRKGVENIREPFINAIHTALMKGRDLNLDFIYGACETGEKFTPLDGQQRLTTLWLLHWLAAARERIGEEANILKNFTYETRFSTRRFCEFMTDGTFAPTFKRKLSDEIKDSPEFFLGWEDDHSVAGMLTMLDALNKKFYGAERMDGLWGKLNHITFFRESIETLGATDDIYIKMNSRGKPLTKFESIKVELDRLASDGVFSMKMDTD